MQQLALFTLPQVKDSGGEVKSSNTQLSGEVEDETHHSSSRSQSSLSTFGHDSDPSRNDSEDEDFAEIENTNPPDNSGAVKELDTLG